MRQALLKMGDPRKFTIHTTGHSLGGYVAMYLFGYEQGLRSLFFEKQYLAYAMAVYGIKEEEMNDIVGSIFVRCYTFNMGSSPWKGEFKSTYTALAKNKNVRVIRVKGDAVSNWIDVEQDNIWELNVSNDNGSRHKMDNFTKAPKHKAYFDHTALAHHLKVVTKSNNMHEEEIKRIEKKIQKRIDYKKKCRRTIDDEEFNTAMRADTKQLEWHQNEIEQANQSYRDAFLLRAKTTLNGIALENALFNKDSEERYMDHMRGLGWTLLDSDSMTR